MRFIHLLICSLVLAGCYGGGSPSPKVRPAPKPIQDRAPSTSQQDLTFLANLPDPPVLEEPRSRGGNGPVYTVFGKRYKVMDSAEGFSQTGTASWYGTKFHGRNTSNGERFDIYKLTAAHKHLPLPSYVRVTNLNNGKATVVRVNDRGPFHDNRIIDLSYAAAVKLGFHDKGTAPVRIEVLSPNKEYYLLQASAHKTLDAADRAKAMLRELTGMSGVVVRTASDQLYRVQLGPIQAGSQLDRLTSTLRNSEFGVPRLIQTTR